MCVCLYLYHFWYYCQPEKLVKEPLFFKRGKDEDNEILYILRENFHVSESSGSDILDIQSDIPASL